ncbi:hypothetical protein [Acidisphaera sp. S103]|uniref:hypothetical protein n=1 Tax=Acidisphaera sp. S103 TaxID=1747223 RepID=UPI00131E7164|nr:hypothetical protein [Acidisphaera sp. S103]
MVDSPDAAIVALCDSLIEIEIEATALVAQRLTIADERRTEAQMTALERRRADVVAELMRRGPPRTMTEIRAVARASLATHGNKNGEGAVVPICCGHWLALTVCECLADV